MSNPENLQLHSDELLTENRELLAQNEELTRLSSMLNNLLAATDVGAIFLNSSLQVSYFTPRSTELFELKSTDVGQAFQRVPHHFRHTGLAGLVTYVHETSQPLEETVQSKSGSWYDLRIFPSRVTTDERDGVVITFVDISNLKRAESEERQRRQQQLLAQLSRQALAGDDLESLFVTATEKSAAILEMEYCKVLELQEDGEHLFLHTGIGWQPGLVGRAMVPTDVESQAGYTLQADGPVVVRDLWTENRFKAPELLSQHQVRSGISVTIFGADKPFGVLGIHSKEARQFAPYDVDFIQAIANTLGTAIVRHRTQIALRESEERLRLGTIVAGLGVAEIDYKTDVIRLDAEASAIFGLPAQSQTVPRADIHALFHHDDRQMIFDAIKASHDPGSEGWLALEHRILLATGEMRWLDVRKQVFFAPENGTAPLPQRALLVARDITGRKRVEEERKMSDERYRYLYESMDEGVCVIEMIYDEENRPVDYLFLEANPAFDSLTGLGNPVGKRVRELVPDLEPHWFEIFGQIAQTGQPQRFEENSDVMNRWFDIYAFPIDSSENRRVAVFFNNVTERKRAELALRTSEERFRSLIEQASDAIFIADLNGVYTDVNSSACKLLGYTREELIGKQIMDITPKSEQDRLDDLKAHLLSTGQTQILEWPLLHKNGTIIPTEISTRVLPSGSWQAIVRDITERQQAEARLRHQDYLLENMQDAFLSTDADFHIQTWNRGAELTYGWTAAEAIGKKVRDLIPTTYVDTDRQTVMDTFLAEGHWYGEVIQRNKRGEELIISNTTTLLRDKDGNVNGTVAINRNITARKQAEERLRFLAEASSLLASSLDYYVTLENFARAAVPNVADWCTVDLLQEDGSIENVVIAHADPEKVQWAQRLVDKYPVDPDAPMGPPAVIRSGEAEYYPDITDELLQAAARDDEQLALLRSVGYRSAMVVPLRTSNRILGAITFVAAESNRPLSEADLTMATDLARHAAVSIENAQLYQAVQGREAELARSEERLRLATQAGHIGIFDHDLVHNYTDYSDIYCKVTGFSPECPPTRERWLERIHPADRPQVEENLKRAREEGKSNHYEYRIYHADGSLHWLDVSTLISTDKAGRGVRLTGAVRDITARKESDAILRRSEERFRSAFEQAAVGMAHLDLQGRYIRVNDRLCEILGYTRQELLQKTFVEITHPDDLEADVSETNTLLRGENSLYKMEKRYLRKDGQYIWVNLTKSIVCNEDGIGQYGIVVVEDISSRKEAEKALQELNMTLEQRVQARTAELEQSNRDLDQFAYVASHDLKAPLRAIDHLSTWIAQDVGEILPPASQKHLDTLRGRVHRMEQLLEDLLLYSRVGRLSSEVELVNSHHLVASLVDLLDLPASFSITIAEEMPTFRTQRVPLEVVLRNLIGNALKHHDREDGNVNISARENGEFVEFIIEDDGPGISAEFHPRIFQIFQTLQPRDEIEGSGIGLAVVKKTVEGMGGTIRVESAAGEGAVFRFTWPKLTE